MGTRVGDGDAASGVAWRQVTQVAGVDARPDAVLVGVRMFAVRAVHLLHPEEREAEARGLAQALGALRVEVRLHRARRDDLPALIDAVAGLLNREADGEAVVNLSSGWESYSFAALTAAFLTGSPAFAVQEDRVVPVPVLRVSYPEVLSPAKLALLRSLAAAGGSASVKDLAAAARLSPSLVSYHLRGYRNRPGLEAMALVETAAGARGHVVRLTPLGRNLLAARPARAVPPWAGLPGGPAR